MPPCALRLHRSLVAGHARTIKCSGTARQLSTSTPRHATPLYMLSRLSHSRETQHFSKASGLGVTNHVPNIEAIKSSEVDPFVSKDKVAADNKPQSLTDFHFFPKTKETPRLATGAARSSPLSGTQKAIPLSLPLPPSLPAGLTSQHAQQKSGPGPQEQLARARLAVAVLSSDRAVLRENFDGNGSSIALRQALARRLSHGSDAAVDAKLTKEAAATIAYAKEQDSLNSQVVAELVNQVKYYKDWVESQSKAAAGAFVGASPLAGEESARQAGDSAAGGQGQSEPSSTASGTFSRLMGTVLGLSALCTLSALMLFNAAETAFEKRDKELGLPSLRHVTGDGRVSNDDRESSRLRNLLSTASTQGLWTIFTAPFLLVLYGAFSGLDFTLMSTGGETQDGHLRKLVADTKDGLYTTYRQGLELSQERSGRRPQSVRVIPVTEYSLAGYHHDAQAVGKPQVASLEVHTAGLQTNKANWLSSLFWKQG